MAIAVQTEACRFSFFRVCSRNAFVYAVNSGLMAADPTGRFLYVSGTPRQGFAIEATSGALSPVTVSTLNIDPFPERCRQSTPTLPSPAFRDLRAASPRWRSVSGAGSGEARCRGTSRNHGGGVLAAPRPFPRAARPRANPLGASVHESCTNSLAAVSYRAGLVLPFRR